MNLTMTAKCGNIDYQREKGIAMFKTIVEKALASDGIVEGGLLDVLAFAEKMREVSERDKPLRYIACTHKRPNTVYVFTFDDNKFKVVTDERADKIQVTVF